MRRGQLLAVAIAGVCGIGAFLGVMSLINKPAKIIREEVTTSTTQVLVAKHDIGLGNTTDADSFRWQDWPQGALGVGYVQRSARPDAIKELAGTVARAPLIGGEPVTTVKLVRAGEGGVLAAILPRGMRAISTRIKEETGVGRLILPNDHVDVILTQRRRGHSGADEFVSDTLFRNVRVLAIGQLIEVRDNKKLAEGNTATLELTPRQTEILALANSMGEISLALRSITDLDTRDQPTENSDKRGNSIKILRYGVKTRAYGVN
jgi:pilus assembly protein CpaB